MPADVLQDRTYDTRRGDLIAAIEGPGLSQHARCDVEATIAQRMQLCRELDQACGLGIDLDLRASGRVDSIDDVTRTVAAEPSV